MRTLTYPINKIHFNNCVFSKIKILSSAQKHYKNKTENIMKHITSTLDNQIRKSDEIDKFGDPIFKIASATTFKIDNNQYDHRDTCFKLDVNKETIIYFHASQRTENQYDNFSDKMKKGFY